MGKFVLLTIFILYYSVQGQTVNSGLTYIEYSAPQNDILNYGINNDAGRWTSFNEYPRYVGHFDEDDFADIIGFGGLGIDIAYGDGSGFNAPTTNVVTSFCRLCDDFAYSSFDDYPRLIGDVDGDGMDDIIGFEDDGIYVSYSLGRGNGFTAKAQKFNGFGKNDSNWTTYNSYPRMTGYIDNDNFLDIVGFTDTGVHIIYGNGRNNFQIRDGTTLKLPNQFRIADSFVNQSENPRRVADVNGDGLGDIIGFNSDVHIAFQNPDGTFGPITSGLTVGQFTPTWGWGEHHIKLVLDINNDGKADIVGFGNSNVESMLSRGQTFDPFTRNLENFFARSQGYPEYDTHPRSFGDINNDGILDIIGFTATGVQISFGSRDRCYHTTVDTTRDLNNNCQCNTGYYDNQDSLTCPFCVYPCSTCSGLNVCINCSTTLNRKTDNTCGCLDTFYDDTSDCVPCNRPCLNCSDSNVCTSCKGSFRKNIASCECEDGYYDDTTNDNCQVCPNNYKVQRCSSSTGTVINECKSGIQRSMNTSDCGCNIGYYDDGSNLNCVECPTPYKVRQCTSSSVITECKSGTQRSLDTSDCGCNEGYYDDGTNIACKICPNSYKVKYCSSDSVIDECKPGSQRSMNTSDCGCNEGYYDDRSNISCVVCPHAYKVKSCSSNTNFISCKSGTQRSMDTSDCGCNAGYYDDGSNIVCLQCANSYKVQACTSSGITSCKSGIQRSLDTSDCGCNEGYYDDGSNINCVVCPNSYRVQDCTSAGISTCKPGIGRTLDVATGCGCSSGFYDDGSSTDCQVCQYPCQNCSDSTTCTSCSNTLNRNIDSTCSCQEGFFDNGSSCEGCDHSICATCNNSATECLIECQEGCILCDKQNNCQQAKDGYFKDPITGVPQKCGRLCQTCVDSIDNCILGCDLSCGLCSGDGNCETCNINSYMGSDRKCKVCQSKCFTCENEITCLTCSQKGLGRSLNINDNCGCTEGYYEIEGQLDCQKCTTDNCRICDSQGVCSQCMNDELYPPLCSQSKKGLLVIEGNGGSNQHGEQCQAKCATCENSVGNCTQCSLGLNRNQDLPCQCKQGFHDNNGRSQDCQTCPLHCEICQNSDICIKCEEKKVLNTFTRQCVCGKGFKLNENSNTCQKCYSYNGECLLECPEFTTLQESTKTCQEHKFIKSSNIYIIWISCTFVLFSIISLLLSGFFQLRKRVAEDQKEKERRHIQQQKIKAI